MSSGNKKEIDPVEKIKKDNFKNPNKTKTEKLKSVLSVPLFLSELIGIKNKI